MVNIAEHAVMADQSDEGAVLIFSMEQPGDQLVMRMLSSLGRIDQTSMRWGNMRDDDWPRFNSAGIQLREKPLYIDDTAALDAQRPARAGAPGQTGSRGSQE